MALKPQDPYTGFRHGTVADFINKKMSRHAKGPEFYLENMSLSWEEIEDKIKAILEDSEMSIDAQEACAWGCLALGLRLALRRGHLQGLRVQWLQDFAKLHKSATYALASDLKQLIEQQEVERKEAAFQLWLAHAKLAQVQKERDLLRWKLLHAELRAFPRPAVEEPEPVQVETLGAGEKQEVAEAEASATGGERGGGEEEEKDVTNTAPEEATQELSESFLHLLRVVQQKNYTAGQEREGDNNPVETATLYLSGAMKATSTSSPEPLPVQLPASFSYNYSSPFSCFPVASTLSPLTALSSAPIEPQMPPDYSGSDVSFWSTVWAPEADSEEHYKMKRDLELHQQRKHPVFRKPGDWDCPWCKAVNFSRRENCFRCGRAIWLQNP
ncbi:testis-expressed protein 13A [Octodon degus]|uniref:Testis-expressed protein 13A n=1 Tax=Octodon degus TaxID=10160 RepID=A0A6P6DQJ1_OCTDE|nr:testis-expressed protein 13A [Octodon degus]